VSDAVGGAEAARREVHARYCRRLDGLLSSPEPPPDSEMTRALYAVFDPEALADPVICQRAEPFLAALICRTAPRSDLIIDRAATAFGWNTAAGEIADPAIAEAVARVAARRGADRYVRLEALLRGPAEPGENTVMAALDAVTAPRVVGDPVHGPAAEVWLARLLLETRPRSEALITVVIRRLGWDAREGRMDPAIEALVALAATPFAPRPASPLMAPPRASAARRGGTAGYWMFAILAVVLFAATALVFLAVNGASSNRYAAGGGDVGGPAPGSGGQETAAPQVVVSPGRVEISMGATETADTFIQCDDIAVSALQGCRILRSTMSDHGGLAMGYVRGLRFTGDDPRAPDGQPIEVHVHWKDMS
jgi:hypothetical protein